MPDFSFLNDEDHDPSQIRIRTGGRGRPPFVRPGKKEPSAAIGCLAILVLVGGCVLYFNTTGQRDGNQREATGIVGSRKWYEGGTLHQKNALAWQVASEADRLATCADFVTKALQEGLLSDQLTRSIREIDDTRYYAQQLRDCLDKAFAPEPIPADNRRMYANQDVSAFAAACMKLMGWLK